MGYRIRVLGVDPTPIPLGNLRSLAEPAALLEGDDATTWEQLVLRHETGAAIALIDRNLTEEEGSLGQEELAEFIEDVAYLKPASGAAWLQSFLPGVKVIYAFQLLNGTEEQDGWYILHKIYSAIWTAAGGILQADGEGFSNESGHTIVWQFADHAEGIWNMGILQESGEWVHFEMDLEDEDQRNAFRLGTVPAGAKLL